MIDTIERALEKARSYLQVPLILQWQDLPLNLKVSNRARRMRLQMLGDQFFLIVPKKVCSKDIHYFLLEAEPWLHKQRHRSQQEAPKKEVVWPSFLKPGSLLPFQGTTILLQGHFYSHSSVYQWVPELGVLSIPQNPLLGSDGICAKQIRIFMYEEGLRRASVWASEYADRLGLAPRSITLKQTIGRWGSLGIHNDMYLNWVLIFAPPSIFQYVVLHEMGHLRYRSHGPRFWKLIARYMPNYDEARRWLRCFGSQIMPPPHLGLSK